MVRVGFQSLFGLAVLATLTVPCAATPSADAAHNGVLAAEIWGPCVGGTRATHDLDCTPDYRGIVSVRPDGSHARRLTKDFRSPLFSADGRYLALQGHGGEGLVVTDPAARHRRWITAEGFIDGVNWSPSGHMLVYGREVSTESGHVTELVRVNANGQSRRRLGLGANPAWSPNGRWIAYTRGRGSWTRDMTRVMVMRSDGQKTRALRALRTAYDADATTIQGWTRDGRAVIYGDDYGHDYYTVDVRTGHVRKVLPPLYGSVVSPDGLLRATISDGSMFVAPRGGGQRRRILGPPTRWGGVEYRNPAWQALP